MYIASRSNLTKIG